MFNFKFKSADTIDNLIITLIAQMVLEILSIPLALITVKIIKDYSKVEPLLAQISDEEPEINNENKSLYNSYFPIKN